MSRNNKKHPKNYNQRDVTNWLESIGLGHKADILEENCVDGSLLVTLTADDLKDELGFTNLQARKFERAMEAALKEFDDGSGGGATTAGDRSPVSSGAHHYSSTAAATAARNRATAPPPPSAPRDLTPEEIDFDQQCEEAIPADVRMISGCHDTQTSADVGDVGSFQLPNAPPGQAGGACTSAILQVVYKEHQNSSEGLTFMDVFLQTRDVIASKGFKQIPQLSSSRRIDVNQPFNIMSDRYGDSGTRYAVLIGINYANQSRGRLNGCHNDVKNIRRYIQDVGRVRDENIVVLMDDGRHTEPTKRNIMNALKDLTRKVRPGDTGFVHYSGHGSRVKDPTGLEESGFASTLVPVDFDEAGQILDDDLYEHLVCAMPKGTTLTCLMDCCHSGTVLDLPYNFVADGESYEMTAAEGFPFVKLLQLLGRALQEAGVTELRDLRDADKRAVIKDVLVENVGDVIGEEQRTLKKNRAGIRKDFEAGDVGSARQQIQENRKARQERRQNRRGKLFG